MRNTSKETIPVDCMQHFKAINDTLYILSGKWKVIIIACLSNFGKKRYMEILRLVEGIGPKMLSKELHELEINGLIKRTVLVTKPVTVEYELTEYGLTLTPIIHEMAIWGTKHRARLMKEMAATPHQ